MNISLGFFNLQIICHVNIILKYSILGKKFCHYCRKILHPLLVFLTYGILIPIVPACHFWFSCDYFTAGVHHFLDEQQQKY